MRQPFFRFHDPTGRRNYPLSVLNNAQLRLWSNERNTSLPTIQLRIYPYGFSIDGNEYKQLTSIERQNDSDRAGASREASITDIQKKLKNKFGDRWVGYDAAWRMWANDIATSNQDVNTMENGEPPRDLIHLFNIRTPETVSSAMGSRINANSMAITALKDARNALTRVIETFSIVERYLKADSSWAEEVSSSLRFVEQVTVQEDVDHQ